MGDMRDTQFITLQENTANAASAAQVLEQVYIALTEKGTRLILPVIRTPEVLL